MSIGPARFPFVRDLEGFDFAAQPSLDKKQIREIATGHFIANIAVVMLLGPPGTHRRSAKRQSRYIASASPLGTGVKPAPSFCVICLCGATQIGEAAE